ncbi:MAG: urease accessory protein UreD [Oscillospiraceae bacterium]|nr:urease accessory protein UreD [Oscillospiraceae bacterium]
MNENRYGAQSTLCVTARPAGGRTVLADVRFTAPYKILHPFYDENGSMSVMMVSVSAGILSGDSQKIDITVREGARLTVTSQAFEKIHKMDDGAFATRDTRLVVEKDAALSYAPLPVIPFKDSAFRSQTEVRLAEASSRFFQSEIISCGRASRGERFAYREYKSLTKIYEGETLIYADNAVYRPGSAPMERFCLFEGYTHLGTCLMVNQDISEEQTEALRAAVYALKDGVGGVTKTGYGGHCVRALANGSEPLLALNDKIREILGP